MNATTTMVDRRARALAAMDQAENLLNSGMDQAAVVSELVRGGHDQDAARQAVEAIADPITGTAQPPADVQEIRARLWEISQTPKLSGTERYRAQSAAVIEWLHTRGRFYYHADRRDFASVMYFDGKRKLLLPVQGDAFTAWLSDCLAVNRSERTFAFVLAAVETEGLSTRATPFEPAAYWAARSDACYLSNGPGRMVKLSAAGVELMDNGEDGVLFPYGTTLAPWTLCEPVNPFEACTLFRDLSTAALHGRTLAMLWTVALPTDQRTKPPLCPSGGVGSGKTRFVRGVFELYGMPERVAAVTRNGESDFWAALDAGGLCCFDNADTRTDWLPDALAAAATAGTQQKRRLYTDADNVTLRARSWVAVTSANPTFAADAGLADRLLVIRLNRRQGETAEATLSDEIARHRSGALSWISHTLALALADSGPIPSGLNARHPDFAALAVRIGRALGREDEAVQALRAAETDKGLFNLENDTIGAALLELLQAGPFTGTAAELLAALIQIDPSLDGRMSVKRLGKRLSALWPHLESALKATIETVHGGFRQYRFTPRAGDFGDFQTVFSEKSPRERKAGVLPKTPLESHQTHQEPTKELREDWQTADHAAMPATQRIRPANQEDLDFIREMEGRS